MHILSFGLNNFRNFKEQVDIEFGPISLLTGPNNSGKSGAIKALLLLKDTMIANSLRISKGGIPFPKSLVFNNKSRHALGGLSYVLNQSSSQNSMSITLPFLIGELEGCPTAQLNLVYSLNNDENQLTSVKIQLDNELLYSQNAIVSNGSISGYDYQVNLGYVLKCKENGLFIAKPEKIASGKKYKWQPMSTKGKINLFGRGSDTPSNSSLDTFGVSEYVHSVKEPISKSLLQLADFVRDDSSEITNSEIIEEDLGVLEGFFLSKIFDKEGLACFSFKGHPSSVQNILFEVIGEILNKSWTDQKTTYRYSIGSVITHFASSDPEKESKAIYIDLTDLGDMIIGFYDRLLKYNFNEYLQIFNQLHYYPNPDVRFENIVSEQDTLLYDLLSGLKEMEGSNEEYKKIHSSFPPYTFIQAALSHLKIGDKLEIKPISDYGYELLIVKDSETIRLKDSGFGIRKLVSLILLLASRSNDAGSFDYEENFVSYRENIIILEEPESNLHPMLQSELAEVIIFAATHFNSQFIIETHSEYLIRKLQFLTATYDDLHQGDIVIHYFNRKEDNLPPKEIQIEKNGMLTDDFGKGFFDEANNLAIDLFNLRKGQKN